MAVEEANQAKCIAGNVQQPLTQHAEDDSNQAACPAEDVLAAKRPAENVHQQPEDFPFARGQLVKSLTSLSWKPRVVNKGDLGRVINIDQSRRASVYVDFGGLTGWLKPGSLAAVQPSETEALLPIVAPSPQVRVVATQRKSSFLNCICICGSEPRKEDPVRRLVGYQDATPKRFYIGGLPSGCDADMLRHRFSEYGSISTEGVVVNARRQCGYITFDGPNTLEMVTSDITMSTMWGLPAKLEVKMYTPQADAPEVHFGSQAADNTERFKVASNLASKGFTVKWLLDFWREFGERPEQQRGVFLFSGGERRNVLHPAAGQWKGRIKRTSTTNDVVRNLVIPDTVEKECCYMDLVPNTAVKPGKLVSHWWGANFLGDLMCILQDATGLTGEMLRAYIDYDYVSPSGQFNPQVLQLSYWMCIFAVNQHVSICGMCNDCNVVSTGSSCSVCGADLYNPCLCGRTKYKTGHVMCQMDKFDIVMAQMENGLAVALDSQLRTLERVWVLSEIGKSLEMEQKQNKELISWQMPNDIDDCFCGTDDIHIQSIRNCSASLPADKDRILQQVQDAVGIDHFDENVRKRVLPILRKYALVKLVPKKDSDDAVNLLLTRQADPDSETTMGRSVLFEAARRGNLVAVRLLLDAKADFDKQDTAGAPPLFFAAANGHVSVVQALIAVKADVDRADNNGSTPAFQAAQAGHSGVLHHFIAARADLNKSCLNGATPVSTAATAGHLSAVESLIATRVDVNRSMKNGGSPLINAAIFGHIAVVECLVNARADINRSVAGEGSDTALSFAEKRKHHVVVDILRNAGAIKEHTAPAFISETSERLHA